MALAPGLLTRTARELSGSQRQRVAYCPGAGAGDRRFLVLDKATSARWMSRCRRRFSALLQQLQQQLGLTYLFITRFGDGFAHYRQSRHGTARRSGYGTWRRQPRLFSQPAALYPRTHRRYSPPVHSEQRRSR